MVDSAPQFTLKRIPSHLEIDIDACLIRYFKDTSQLSTLYWPRAVRTFLSTLLLQCKRINAVLEKLQLDVSKVDELIAQLELPTLTSIHVEDRKTLGDLLRWLKLHGSSIPATNTSADIYTENPCWPNDIASYLDLNTSVSAVKIRRDVTNFLHFIMRNVTHESIGYEIKYVIPVIEPDESVEKFFPIRIFTDDEDSALRARDMFSTESELLRNNVKNLLPSDLVRVEVTSQALSAGIKVEMYLASGCP